MNKARKASLTKLANAAFRRVAVQVVLRARQTDTPVIIWKDGRVQAVPWQEFEPKKRSTRKKVIRKDREREGQAIMPVTIRRATAADAPTIVEFNRLLAEESESKRLDLATLRAGVAAALADPDRKGPYFLAVDGDRILGQLQITFEWSDWRNGWAWWIQSVYVRPEARRGGVFRALYKHVHQLAKRQPDVIALRLYVDRDNHVAQQTYRDMGMEEMNYFMLQKYPL
jgi:GNAT superfamily N-acetyltransferase